MDGTAIARRIVEESAKRAADITERTGTVPCLATVLVGEYPASVTYVRMKQNRCRAAGVTSCHVPLPAGTTTEQLVGTLHASCGSSTSTTSTRPESVPWSSAAARSSLGV